MSLKPTDTRYVPKETARVAKAAFPKGNLAIFLRDELEGLYSDDLFTDLYPKGKPAQAPWRLALVTILQFAEDLSDREAAKALAEQVGSDGFVLEKVYDAKSPSWAWLADLEAVD